MIAEYQPPSVPDVPSGPSGPDYPTIPDTPADPTVPEPDPDMDRAAWRESCPG